MQNTIVNMGEVKSFLSSIISLIPDLEDVVMKAKEVMPHGEIALQKSLDIVSETNVSGNERFRKRTGKDDNWRHNGSYTRSDSP